MGRRIVAVVLLMLLSGAGGWLLHARAYPADPRPVQCNWVLNAPMRVQEWREDIDYLAAELVRRHPNAFFKCQRAEFEEAAAALRVSVPRLHDDQVVVGLMQLAAMIGDAHTGIGVWSLSPAFHPLPIVVEVFSEGPVITAAGESQKDLVGCTLVKFGEVPINDAFKRAATVSAYENQATFMEQAPRLLCTREIAGAVGLVPNTQSISVLVRDAQGLERTVELKPLEPGQTLWTPPIDQPRLPLSRQKRTHRNWFEIIPGRKVGYLRYDTCTDEPGQTVGALCEQALAGIDADHLQRLIVDVSGNGGGNSGLLAPLISGLKRRSAVNHPGGVIVLIGRRTFSSAFMNAAELKAALGATLIGEPTGQKPNAYGEVRTFTLPHSRIEVHHSTKFWRSEPGDRPSMDPDVLVTRSWADHIGYRDPVFEAALEFAPK